MVRPGTAGHPGSGHMLRAWVENGKEVTSWRQGCHHVNVSLRYLAMPAAASNTPATDPSADKA